MMELDTNPNAWEESLRADGFGGVIDSPFFQRLRGVSFLAVLDQVYSIETRSSRYEHSLGVAYAGQALAEHLGLPRDDRHALILIGLLHDLGHAPFSHNSEPFVRQYKRVYHEGLLTNYLRFDTAFPYDGDYTFGSLLKGRSAYVQAAVLDSLRRKAGNRPSPPVAIHCCPVNTDKIDGTNRTLRHLRKRTIPAQYLLECFCIRGRDVGVRQDRLQRLVEFRDLEEEVYWTDIYTDLVFGAEAMLTRALELSLTSKDAITRFVQGTDDDALNMMRETGSSAHQLVDDLVARRFWVPISELNLLEIAEYRPRFESVRFDVQATRDLERDLSNRYGRKVISHFSRRKLFHKNILRVTQLSLFEDELVPIRAIRKMLWSSKVSGDYFNIFVEPDRN